MDSDDDNEFLREMSDVVPMEREVRVGRKKGSQSASGERDESLAIRRQAAVASPEQDRNTLSDREIPPLDAWYVLDFKRPGIQNGVYRKLKQGRYEAEARLDLHRMTVQQARRELFEFLEEAHRLGLRSVLVIHGKGESRAEREQGAVLKGYVDHWLRDLPAVQAFHSARRSQGGTGAAYVLLSKSEEKKRENRERFNRGRTTHDPD